MKILSTETQFYSVFFRWNMKIQKPVFNWQFVHLCIWKMAWKVCQGSGIEGKPLFLSLAGVCAPLCFTAAGSSWQSTLLGIGVSWFCPGGCIYSNPHKMLLKANPKELFLFSYILEGTVKGSWLQRHFQVKNAVTGIRLHGWRTSGTECIFRKDLWAWTASAASPGWWKFLILITL